MITKFSELAKIFCLEGTVENISVIPNGHINSTYDVTIKNSEKTNRYVFQKINTYVFKNPTLIMKNIEGVTSHISKKLESQGKSRDFVMHFAHTKDGNNYYVDNDGFWRISEYVTDSVAINSANNLSELRSAGKAFGNFQTMLSDFDATKLYETIPDFHNTRNRINTLTVHVKEDPCKRVEGVKEELKKIEKFTPVAIRLNELVDSNELPLRVTHNDTKINNVLFDKNTGDAKTVIDLDTVMPGLVAHDFGDAIRFAANTAVEDEPDLSKVSLDIERFRAFSEGFIPEVAKALTPMEIKTLALGAFVMTLELVVRFLDDYITGDMYFKTHYSDHNLVRARCQLKLAEDIYDKLDEMNNIVSEISGMKF
ncbi:MAG: aminoglycoside phosphotransferase family protein [Ruminococcaceae bacterium]|nr:aminoglycoside phosphotransferase family protein [Oscillospiraceae bacterium]